MGFWDDIGAPQNPWEQFDAPHVGNQNPYAADAPNIAPGNPGMGSLGGPNIAPQAAQAGQWAPTNQGFLDWATKTFGASPGRGGGFVDIPDNQRAAVLQRYTQETGNKADYQRGPSGDRVDFGQGTQDAFTSGGQIWNAAGGSGGPNIAPAAGGGGRIGGGSLGSGGMTVAQQNPFTYQASTLGGFKGPDPWSAPDPFKGTDVPTMGQHTYNPLADPQKLDYERYTGVPGDSSYDFRFKQGQAATENALAHSGALRTGNAAKALADYGQGMASTEYAAEDARRRSTTAMNNAAALGFGAQNFDQGFRTNQANNAGQFNTTQANNQNALQQQQQQYGQQANTYGMNAGLGQGAQAQAFNQALAGYGANQGAQNQDFNQALSAYQANTASQLGFGNLGLGYQNSNNSYNLGLGNLDIARGNLDLSRQGQNFNQGFMTNQQNYQQQVMDPWSMNLQLAQLGNPGQANGQGYANAGSDLITGGGNAAAAGQVGSGNAWGGALGNLGLSAQQLAYLQMLGGGGGA